MRRLFGGALVTLIAVAGYAQTPAPSYRMRVLGVFDAGTGEPVEGVSVTDMGTGTWALTTKTGTVTLAFLPVGESTVRIRKLGFTPIIQTVRISPADTAPITLILTPVVTKLPDVVTVDSAPHWISPGLRDFEERRKHGLGTYIDEKDLRKNDGRDLSDVLRRVPSFRITCSTRTPRSCNAFSTRGGCGRPATIYLDGVRVTDPNLLMYQVVELGAIEAYNTATAPAQYNATSSGCGGVLLLWTRER